MPLGVYSEGDVLVLTKLQGEIEVCTSLEEGWGTSPCPQCPSLLLTSRSLWVVACAIRQGRAWRLIRAAPLPAACTVFILPRSLDPQNGIWEMAASTTLIHQLPVFSLVERERWGEETKRERHMRQRASFNRIAPISGVK